MMVRSFHSKWNYIHVKTSRHLKKKNVPLRVFFTRSFQRKLKKIYKKVADIKRYREYGYPIHTLMIIGKITYQVYFFERSILIEDVIKNDPVKMLREMRNLDYGLTFFIKKGTSSVMTLSAPLYKIIASKISEGNPKISPSIVGLYRDYKVKPSEGSWHDAIFKKDEKEEYETKPAVLCECQLDYNDLRSSTPEEELASFLSNQSGPIRFNTTFRTHSEPLVCEALRSSEDEGCEPDYDDYDDDDDDI